MSASSPHPFSVTLLQRNHRAACSSTWSSNFDFGMMIFGMHRSTFISFGVLILSMWMLPALQAAAQSATLRGQVKDESGAVIPGATVTATSASGVVLSVVSAADGSYVLKPVQWRLSDRSAVPRVYAER